MHRDGRRWVFYWEDGRLSEGDAFYTDKQSRFPWWLLVPFCLLSMGLEALWQGWDVK